MYNTYFCFHNRCLIAKIKEPVLDDVEQFVGRVRQKALDVDAARMVINDIAFKGRTAPEPTFDVLDERKWNANVIAIAADICGEQHLEPMKVRRLPL